MQNLRVDQDVYKRQISDIGIMCTEGILKGNENGGFVSADETVRKMLPYNQEYVLKEGTYPEKAQEIAAGRAFFDAVGYHDVKVGDTVTLEYRSGTVSYTHLDVYKRQRHIWILLKT